MCYDPGAAPPVYGEPVTLASASPLVLTSADGAEFAAFLARPERASGTGVLILPDNRGLHGFYEQLAVRLAEQGHAAIVIDYYGRTAGTDVHGRSDDFARMDNVMPHLVKLTADGLDGDVTAALDHLRAAPPDGAGCRSLVSLGFCLGGRFAFLTARPQFGLAGAIGLYGFPFPDPVKGAPGPTQRAGELLAPILALFGGADEGIPASAVAELDRALADAGVEHEIVTYPGVPHSFFDRQLPAFAEASADAWRRILAFIERHGG